MAEVTHPSTPSGKQLRHNRNFNIFWAGQVLSVLGDAFGFLALPLLVLEATGSLVQMGLVTGMFGMGQIAAGIFSGTLVDHVDRRRLMLVCDIGRLALYGSIPVTWGLAGPQLWLIYVVTGLAALLGNVFQVASITAIPNLVDKGQITEANGRLHASYNVMFLIGPSLAGFVSHQFGPATAIGIDAASFLASAASLVIVRLRQASADHSGAPTGRPIEELLAGMRFLMHEPVLRSVALLIAPVMFLSAAGMDLFIFHLKHNLGHDDNMVGLLLGFGSLGGIVGALLAPRMRHRFGFAFCWLGGGFLEGAAIFLIGSTSLLFAIFGFLMVLNLGQAIRNINSMSLRQEITPDYLLGRVTAAFWLLMTVPGPLGAATMSALATQIGAPAAFMIIGVGSMSLAAIGLFTPIRTRQPHPRPLPAE